jgi:hypothetical protein
MFFVIMGIDDNELNAQNFKLQLSSNPLNYRIDQELDSIGTLRNLNKFRNYYILNSYLEFNIDSVVWSKNLSNAFLHIGPQYKIVKLNFEMDSVETNFQNIKTKYLMNNFDSLRMSAIANEILNNLENIGYPFCQVETNYKIIEQGVDAKLVISKGPYFVFDTLHNDGEFVVKKKFIEAYTGIKSGAFYNEALFRKAHDKLQQLPFLYSERIPQLIFMKNGKAKPYYYLRKKKSDQLNGIIGLAPNTISQSIPGSKNLVFTGEFSLKLNNLFKTAKVLSIQWKSFQARSQELKTYFSFPYVFYKPIGIDLGLDLLKYDTLYTVLQRQIGFQYYTSGINGIKAFYKISTTNLNTVDTNQIRANKQFPNFNSIQLSQYGIMTSFVNLDYKFNPRKGYVFESSLSVGVKQILKDNTISEVRFGPNQYNLYDSSILKTNQYQYQLKIDYFLPIKERSAFKFGLNLNQVIAPQIYFNELQREGGINSLKGFNEQSIFASNFNMLDIEYRYLIGLNSHFKVFWNGAYYENKSIGIQDQVFDMPWGFGIGGNIETRAGILTIAYGLGKQKGNNFDLRTGKFHFGINSYF